MALIKFDQIAHCYSGAPQSPSDYALQQMTFSWRDGGAYALLGPSGCGKTTLLNICSGLLQPSEGRVYFNDVDVTQMSPEARNIAQVFQFPVLYDSMTVYNNLAFPLRNRKVDKKHIRERIHEVADMLDLQPVLKRRAANLGAELKQKISMGRGLVRDDTSAILFDEPLTVIDPQLKWQLRRKLKEIHKQFNHTLIYVTHDQVEALTFAEQVVVMSAGKVVQVGTPQALFERPEHTFVGYFIGSPGMNLLPCHIDSGHAVVEDQQIPLTTAQLEAAQKHADAEFKLGIRPEFATLNSNDNSLKLQVKRISDMGQFQLVTGTFAGYDFKLKVADDQGPIAAGELGIKFPTRWICLYADEQLIDTANEAAHG